MSCDVQSLETCVDQHTVTITVDDDVVSTGGGGGGD